MKHIQLLFLISILIININCKKEKIPTSLPPISPEEEMFFRFVNKVYKIEDKYYISACGNLINGFEEFGMEREINLKDTISFISGRQSSVTYIVTSLNSDSIELIQQTRSTGCLVMPGQETPSEFKSKPIRLKIKCHHQRSIISDAFIDNKKVNAKTAKEYLSKGKIYLLKTKENRDLTYGKQYERDECFKEVSKNFGFEYYPISLCVPNLKVRSQIADYNAVIFEYLKRNDNFNYKNIFKMEMEFRKQLFLCRSNNKTK